MLKIKTIIYTALVAHILVALGFNNMGPVSALAYEVAPISMQKTPVLLAAVPRDPTPQMPYPTDLIWTTSTPTPPSDPIDPISGFTYKEYGDRITVTGYLGKESHVIVPDTIYGKKVTGIGERAFQYFPDITHITISGNITDMADLPYYCNNLINITVDKSNRYFKDIDGVLFSKDGTIIMCYPPGRLDTHYVIPDGVTSIKGVAFSRCSLTSISIPDSVTMIDNDAFYACSITSITIPDSVTNIGDRAFQSSDITSITIPSSVTSIGDSSFAFCSELITVTISDGVTSIGDGAFSNCVNLSNVTVPRSVTRIGGWAFADSFVITVTCPSNSYTHQYCLDRGIKFLLVEPTATATTATTGTIDDDDDLDSLLPWIIVGGSILALVVITIIALGKKRKEQD